MNRIRTFAPHVIAVIAALVFLDSLRFKFTNAPETQIIFGKLDAWAASFGAGGLFAQTGLFSQYVIGTAELAASALLLLGIIPGAGGTQRLSRLVGPAKAKDLIFTGRFVDAAEALAIGLVDQVHPADEVYAKSVEWASQFVGGPALALRAAKGAVDRGLEVDLQTGLEIERIEFAGLFATDDRTSGMTYFVDNGPGKATFTGS